MHLSLPKFYRACDYVKFQEALLISIIFAEKYKYREDIITDKNIFMANLAGRS
jgi:hypothetical protein